MTPQLWLASVILLIGIILIIVCFIFAKRGFITQKKVIGGIVFLLGFLFLFGIYSNLKPYFGGNSVMGQVTSASCSDIQHLQVGIGETLPDCNYQVTYNLNNQTKTANINSMSSGIVLSQGQQVKVYYDSNNAVTVGQNTPNQSLLSFLISHWMLLFILIIAIMFFYVGLKWMGLINNKSLQNV